jgi:PAS domain S-box-containing protein
MRFADLVAISELQALCESFTALTGAVTAILDLDGKVLVATGWQDICTKFHRVHPETASRCLESDTRLAGQLANGQVYNLYKCRNGLVDVAVPIIIGGAHLANFFTGQFFLEEPDRERFLGQAEAFGFEPEAYLAALGRAPVFSEAKVQAMMEFFTRLARLVGNMGHDRANQEKANQELAESRQLLQTIIDTVPMRVFWKDQALRYLGCNPAFAADAGKILPEEVIGKDDYQLGWKDLADGYREADREVLASGTGKPFYDEDIIGPDGKTFRARTAKVPLRNQAQETIGLLGIYEDVTGRRQAEEELARYRDHLEEQVVARTAELLLAREAAETANRAKSAFLANMSHEIRTPMNAILGMTHLALQTPLSVKQQDYLTKVQTAADSLLGLINDILDFSKIEAGKLDLEVKDFLLEEVLDRVTTVIATRASERKLEFMLDIAPEVPACLVGDPLRLAQVLINLCGNAVKFSDGGEVVVAISRLGGTGDGPVSLQFSVRDTGIGMTEDQVRQLFKPFSQVDPSSTRRFQGTGLGLSICKYLTELMGGEIWVESRPGGGSLFTFTASFGLGRLASGLPRETPPDLHHLRVLVVDDSEKARAILRGLIASLGYRVTVSAAGSEALVDLVRAAGEEDPFDLVILDWRMPGTDGLELSRQIRRLPTSIPAPKILMVTAYGDESVQQLIENEDLQGYLAKPVTASMLFDAILGAFRRGEDLRQPRLGLPVALETGLRGAQVLLVEDNDFNQQVAAELLAMIGVAVTIAGNGKDALDNVGRQPFDAVLMDLQMPEMDGYQSAALMRRRPELHSLPIIAMTAHALVEERAKCLAMGMNDYLTKPIDPSALARILGKWIHLPGPAGEQPEAPQAGPARSVELPGVSWAEGLGFAMGREDLYRKLLRRYLDLRAGDAVKCRMALGRGDLEGAGRIAHSMISAAATIGARNLARTAQALEQAITAGDPSVTEERVDLFQRDLQEVTAGLAAFFS